jgi:hypothetical protein
MGMRNKTITVDIESYSQLCVLGNTTGGIPAGAMNVIGMSRQTGKSMYMKLLKNRIYDSNLCNEILLPMRPATKPKYQFSRAKWYSAEITGHATWRMSDEYNSIIEWCTEQFGNHPDKPDAWSRWWVGVGVINFRDEKDFVFYKLKWS